MDYTAGASHGPHHQPTPFEDDQHYEWPTLLLSKEGRPPNKAKGKPQGHQCFYCGERGHWNLQCPYPHNKCHEEKKCVVPLGHWFFRQACHYGGRTMNNHPDPTTQYSYKRKRHTTPADFAPPQNPTITPNNTPTGDGLPPADSLLFSPNPPQSRLDPLAQSFLPSRYQGQAPPPGTWGNAPWGTSWEEASQRPPSPCIFEYGRGGSEPLYLGSLGAGPASGHTTTTKEESSQEQDSATTVATDLLPYDFGVEDLSQYDERDLPGAIYDYEDDPLAPTAAKVAEYRQRLLRDLGVSV